MRILVVEDERPLGHAIALALRNGLGAHVDLAHDGAAAVQLIERHRYALALLDWWVPPPTGLELLKLLKSVQHGRQNGSIVMMSATYAGPERAEALVCGADLYLEKPFSLTDLIDQCRGLLEASNQDQARDAATVETA